MRRALLVLVVLTGPARAEELDPCAASITDPVPTPLRDAAIDAQRAACTRDELSAYGQADILIDTPGFHGELGGEARVGGRMRIGRSIELSAVARVVRYGFAQTAVNKATDLSLGPLTIGGAYVTSLGDGANLGLTALVEVPATRDDLDSTHVSGELGCVLTAALSPRTVVHARLGLVGMRAWSSGGSTARFAARAGLDLVRRLGARVAVGAGVDSSAGWYAGHDHLAVRLGVQWRMFDVWRGAVGVGLPVAGVERTNAIITLGLVRDLR